MAWGEMMSDVFPWDNPSSTNVSTGRASIEQRDPTWGDALEAILDEFDIRRIEREMRAIDLELGINKDADVGREVARKLHLAGEKKRLTTSLLDRCRAFGSVG